MDNAVTLEHPPPAVDGVTLAEVYASVDALRDIVTRIEQDEIPSRRPEAETRHDVVSLSTHLTKIRDYMIACLLRMKLTTNFQV